MSNWTEQRLQRLFDRYNLRFWGGRLPRVRVRVCDLDCYGECDFEREEIRIDIDRHANNDREIRATLLHEMAHVAAGPGHSSKFWLQIENLLRKKAPISVGFPETGGLQIVKNAVPSRFPLARRMLNKVHDKEQRRLEALARRPGVEDYTMTDEDLVQEFADSTIAALPWKAAMWFIGSCYGLLDVDRKPTDRRSATIISRGKKLHYTTRRELLEAGRIKASYEGHQPFRLRGAQGNAHTSSATPPRGRK
jgi:hypothetical protein